VSTSASNALGQVDVTLPSRLGGNTGYEPFGGFIAIDDPKHDPPRVIPTLLLLDSWFPRPYPFAIDTLVFTPSLSPEVFSEKPVPGKGVVAGVVFDCRMLNAERATGLTVELSSSPQAKAYYAFGSTTANTGFFVVPNVTPGQTTLSAHAVSAHDDKVEVASMRVPVVADSVTYLWLWPSTAAP
jgi:hypothetical protein